MMPGYGKTTEERMRVTSKDDEEEKRVRSVDIATRAMYPFPEAES